MIGRHITIHAINIAAVSEKYLAAIRSARFITQKDD